MNSLVLRVISCKRKDQNLKKVTDKKNIPIKLPSYCNQSATWYETLKKANTIPGQVDAIRNIFQNLRGEPEAISFVADLYYRITPKHAVRNQITRLLIKAAEFGTGGVDKDLIVSTLAESLRHYAQETEKLESCNAWNEHIISMLDSMKNFECGVLAMERNIVYIFPILMQSLRQYIKELSATASPSVRNEYCIYIQTSLRIMLCLIQEFPQKLTNKHSNLLEEMKLIAVDIINDGDMHMDARIGAGILVAQISKIFNEYIEFVSNAKSSKNPNDIVLCVGVVNTTDEFIFEKHSADLRDICGNIIELANNYAYVPPVLVCAARGLNHMAKALSTYALKSTTSIDNAKLILRKQLIFAFGYLTHHLDSLRSNCREMIKNIVSVAMKINFMYLIEKIYDACNSQRLSIAMKCIVLQGTSYIVGPNEIIKNVPGLFDNIFSNHLGLDREADDLFLNLMRHSFKELFYEDWFRLWPKYLIDAAAKNDERLPKIEELIIEAVQLEPQVMHYIINQTEEKLPTTVTISALWAVRKEGLKIFNFTEILEDYSVDILHSILSKDNEPRVKALRLLVETNKKTEALSQLECDHMLTFLEYNSNIQTPAMCHLVLSSFTKAMERLNSNLKKILKKPSGQQIIVEEPKPQPTPPYQLTFLQDLMNLLVRNLFPGANFSRRKLSLRLLEQCFEICVDCDLDFKAMLPECTVDVLCHTFTDTYENNKDLACKLLIFIENQLDERLINKYFIDINLEGILSLLVSVRPTDSITAAYQLEFYCNKASCEEFGDFKVTAYRPSCYAALMWLKKHLKSGLKLVKHSILQAAKYNPLYGLLLATKQLMSKLDFSKIAKEPAWRAFVLEIIELCEELTESVMHVVNSSSPEGHLPNDFGSMAIELLPEKHDAIEQIANDSLENIKILSSRLKQVDLSSVRTTPQMVLLCAWRTVKEVSHILGDIVLYSPIENIPETVNFLLTKEQIIEIGLHFTKMLSETKHRGAFEQAYVGFSKFCLRIWSVESHDLNQLPMQWLTELMGIIAEEVKVHEKLCATRRSAGVPFLIQALITSELQVGTTTALNYCMTYLLDICSNYKEKNSESRTHALNILRSLYRNTDLNEAVSPFVSEGVMCALRGYDANDWSEKNSATLLFSALMTRIFGVSHTAKYEPIDKRNKMTGRIFFTCYGKLYDFFLQLLKEASTLIQREQKQANKLHPLLLILNRLYPSALEGFETNLKLSVFIPYISECTGSPDIYNRKLAARGVVALLTQDAIPTEILKTCAQIVMFEAENIKDHDLNKIHGHLLQLLMLVQVAKPLKDSLVSDISYTLVAFYDGSGITNPIIIKTILDIYLEILNCQDHLSYPQSTIQNLLYFSTQRILSDPNLSRYYPAMRRTFCIYVLHTMRLTLPFGAITDYLLNPPITNPSVTIEHADTCIDIILLILLKSCNSMDYDFEEYDFFTEELEFINGLPKEMLQDLAKELKASQLLEHIMKMVNKKTIFYPVSTLKSFAILSTLDHFDFTFTELMKENEKYTGEMKSSIAMCVERYVLDKGVEYKLSHKILEYLMDIATPSQPICLRSKAVKILAHIAKHYHTALKDKQVSFVRMYIYCIITLLMDPEPFIRNLASDIVLANLIQPIELDNVVATMGQRLFLQYTADILMQINASDNYILEIFQIILETFSENKDNDNISDEESEENDKEAYSTEIELFESSDSNLFAEPYKVITDALIIFQTTFKEYPKIIEELVEYRFF